VLLDRISIGQGNNRLISVYISTITKLMGQNKPQKYKIIISSYIKHAALAVVATAGTFTVAVAGNKEKRTDNSG